MKKIIILLLLSVFIASCAHQVGRYTVHIPRYYGQYVAIFADNQKISTIHPAYRKEIAAIAPLGDSKTCVEPIYSSLIERGGVVQPEPLDDINGDGKPDIVCIERQTALINGGPKPVAIRFFTVDGRKVTESKPLIIKIGEIIYFRDFNRDGIPELVLTDDERHFTYRKDGLPDSSEVYYWNTTAKEYKQCSKK